MTLPPPSVIADRVAMADALAWIGEDPWIAFDTEFLRERTYYPQLCLVQLATPRARFCIDALQVTDLQPLYEFLAQPRRCKIVHAARQDLEALSRAGALACTPLFDTQIAAALAGYPDQVAYAWLVEACCGVVLDKSQTRTDWTQRPLSNEQLDYALADVEYLGSLREHLLVKLDANGKLAWLMEEGARVVDSLPASLDPAQAWRRLRGITGLGFAPAAKARALATWREERAQALDLPRGWLLKDDVLLALAVQCPSGLGEMAQVDGLAPSTIRRYGPELLEIVHGEPAIAPTETNGGWRLAGAGQNLLSELQVFVKARADEVQVAPTLIASRKDLEALVLGDPPSRLLTGWRGSLIGADLTARVVAVPLAERRLAIPRR